MWRCAVRYISQTARNRRFVAFYRHLGRGSIRRHPSSPPATFPARLGFPARICLVRQRTSFLGYSGAFWTLSGALVGYQTGSVGITLDTETACLPPVAHTAYG